MKLIVNQYFFLLSNQIRVSILFCLENMETFCASVEGRNFRREVSPLFLDFTSVFGGGLMIII